MADEKPAPKPESKPAEKDPFIDIITILFVIFIAASVLTALSSFFTSNGIDSPQSAWDRFRTRFTERGIILAHSVPLSSLENPIGKLVVSINDTDVYNTPGGQKIGTHKYKDRGTVLQGPVEIGGERYWYVDYDTEPDGWVREKDIRVVVSEPNVLERFIMKFLALFWVVKLILYLISIGILVFIIYIFRKIMAISIEETKKIYPNIYQNPIEVPGEEVLVNPKWQRVLEYSESENPNDWKLAIIEADIMLAEFLEKLELPGDTIGDKLKLIDPSDFLTLDNAWEAHKVRNNIAHQSATYNLNKREVKRVIALYQSVFEEFEII